jgi:hypothetical protein
MEVQTMKLGTPDPAPFDVSKHVEGSPLDHARTAQRARGASEADISLRLSKDAGLQNAHQLYLKLRGGK